VSSRGTTSQSAPLLRGIFLAMLTPPRRSAYVAVALVLFFSRLAAV